MKIKSITLENHPYFGNITFSFCNANGEIVNNIILAGINGSGKTQLLNLIYEFSTFPTGSGTISSEKRIFRVTVTPEEYQILFPEETSFSNPTYELEVNFNYLESLDFWSRIKTFLFTRDGNGSINRIKITPSKLFETNEKKKLFRSIYSTVEINYSPKETQTVTSTEIDQTLINSLRSGSDLATEIQQLFIDIQASDANALSSWVESHPGEVPPQSVIQTRIKRFKNAFSQIFSNLNYEKIENYNNAKRVLFSKENQTISINDLSSGEKQIVFRGAFLLRNQQSSKGCTILIDEPEISLHPTWQNKIFSYYRSLFCDNNNFQTNQLFIATHSEYVLKEALNSSSSLIIILDVSNGNHSAREITRPLVLPTITSAEINYHAFGIVSNDYHIELYGFLQAKTGNLTVKSCDDYILQSSEYIQAEHNRISTHGRTIYNTLPTYVRNAIDHPDSGNNFTQSELKTSIELLIKLCL